MHIVDSHLHLDFKDVSLNNLLKYMDTISADQCWLLTWEESVPYAKKYYNFSPERIAEAYAKYQERIIPMYAPDPARPEAMKDLIRWHELGFQGCGELKVNQPWGAPCITELLNTIRSLGMPLIFHMGMRAVQYTPRSGSNVLERIIAKSAKSESLGGIPKAIIGSATHVFSSIDNLVQNHYKTSGYLYDFEGLEKRLKEYPTVNFVGHGPQFWAAISADGYPAKKQYPDGPVAQAGEAVKLLDTYPNLYADLSGPSGLNAIQRDEKYGRSFLDRFQDKLLYGTDNFLGLREYLQHQLGNGSVLRKILGENAVRLLKTDT